MIIAEANPIASRHSITKTSLSHEILYCIPSPASHDIISAFHSIESVAPKSPAIIPSGNPKFRPQPACTIGIIARTITPFIPKRTSVFDSEVSTLTPTKGAAMNSPSRNSAMIIRGHPAFCMNLPIMLKPPHHYSLSGQS